MIKIENPPPTNKEFSYFSVVRISVISENKITKEGLGFIYRLDLDNSQSLDFIVTAKNLLECNKSNKLIGESTKISYYLFDKRRDCTEQFECTIDTNLWLNLKCSNLSSYKKFEDLPERDPNSKGKYKQTDSWYEDHRKYLQNIAIELDLAFIPIGKFFRDFGVESFYHAIISDKFIDIVSRDNPFENFTLCNVSYFTNLKNFDLPLGLNGMVSTSKYTKSIESYEFIVKGEISDNSLGSPVFLNEIGKLVRPKNFGDLEEQINMDLKFVGMLNHNYDNEISNEIKFGKSIRSSKIKEKILSWCINQGYVNILPVNHNSSQIEKIYSIHENVLDENEVKHELEVSKRCKFNQDVYIQQARMP